MPASDLEALRRAIAAEREAKKVREAEALRDRTPGETLMMGFELTWFAWTLQEAAERALELELLLRKHAPK